MKPEQQVLPSGRAIERYPIESRDAWLALRQQDVTASAAGALLGGHPYVSAYALWALKSGRIKEEALETAPMRRGRLLEPVAIELLREDRPDWIIERGAHYYRDPAKRLGATPDAFARTEQGVGVVQVKSVEPNIFRRSWHGEDGFEPPLWIALQAMVEATLTGADFAFIAALVVSHGVDLHIVEVDLSHQDAIIGRLEEAIANFWTMLEAGQRPDVDYGRDLELIQDLYKPDGEIISLEQDNEILPLLDERLALGRMVTDAEKRLGVIKGNIIGKLGSASGGILPDGNLLVDKLINRKAYSVGPKSYHTFPVRKKEHPDG